MSQSSKTQPPGATQAALAWHEALPQERLAHLVRDARRGFGRVLQMRLQEHGVASGHWTFLRILSQRDGLTQRELSNLAGVMEPTTFSALQAMEKLGYVLRQRRPDNRKNIYVFLTPEGRELMTGLVPLAEEINGVASAGISPDAIATTRRTLLAIIRNIANYEARLADQPRRPQPRSRPKLATPAGLRLPGAE